VSGSAARTQSSGQRGETGDGLSPESTVTAVGTVSGQPTWFGPLDAPLFGVVHVPPGGRARGGIVICPPFGKEQVDTYRGLKLLAQNLCAIGFAVLRFDYPGTGDSAGEQGADTAIEDYRASISAAMTYLHASGVRRVGLVGLRMGALLATLVGPSASGLTSLVLWDPVTDGRKFLREQRILYKMTVGHDAAETVNESILGMTFSPTAASELKQLSFPGEFPSATSVLVLMRPDRANDARLAAATASHNCTVMEAGEQPSFVESASQVVTIPVATVDAITSWLKRTEPAGAADTVTPTIRRTAMIATLSDGRVVEETIDELGPDRLFGIRTRRVDVNAGGPTLLFHQTACEPRIGSGRVWTETARELAALGVAVVRYDRRGTGETGFATTEFARICSPTSHDDVAAAIAATRVTPDRLMMTGICSGAWNSGYGALRHGARSVVMVNSIMYSLRRVEHGTELLRGLPPPVLSDSPTSSTPGLVPVFKDWVRRWLPYPGWLLLGKLGLTEVPEVMLRAVGSKGVSVHLLLSPWDLSWFEKQRGMRAVRRLRRHGWSPTIVAAPVGDHALLQRDIQLFTRRYLVQLAAQEFELPGLSSEPTVPNLRSEAPAPTLG